MSMRWSAAQRSEAARSPAVPGGSAGRGGGGWGRGGGLLGLGPDGTRGTLFIAAPPGKVWTGPGMVRASAGPRYLSERKGSIRPTPCLCQYANNGFWLYRNALLWVQCQLTKADGSAFRVEGATVHGATCRPRGREC